MTIWVSVKDRLPENRVDVLVFRRGEYNVGFVDDRIKTVIWCDQYGREIESPTHWQPLTPPKEDR